MEKIIERYKVMPYSLMAHLTKEDREHFRDEANRIALLASDDMRHVIAFVGKQGAIIKTQREQLAKARLDVDVLKIKLDAANANANELEAEVERLRDELHRVKLDRDYWHLARNMWHDEAVISNNRLRELTDEFCKKAQWAKAWKRVAKRMWHGFYDDGWKDVFDRMDALESELATCQAELATSQADRDRLQREVDELKAERVCDWRTEGIVLPATTETIFVCASNGPDTHYRVD